MNCTLLIVDNPQNQVQLEPNEEVKAKMVELVSSKYRKKRSVVVKMTDKLSMRLWKTIDVATKLRIGFIMEDGNIKHHVRWDAVKKLDPVIAPPCYVNCDDVLYSMVHMGLKTPPTWQLMWIASVQNEIIHLTQENSSNTKRVNGLKFELLTTLYK